MTPLKPTPTAAAPVAPSVHSAPNPAPDAPAASRTRPSRLWLWFVVAFLVQVAAWTAWFVIASRHKVEEVPLVESGRP